MRRAMTMPEVKHVSDDDTFLAYLLTRGMEIAFIIDSLPARVRSKGRLCQYYLKLRDHSW